LKSAFVNSTQTTLPPAKDAPLQQDTPPRMFWPAFLLSILVMTTLFYLTAWVADDAYIDFRVVDNIRSGFGPVWNVGERVQAFTSPAWVGAVSLFSLATGSRPPIAALLLSLICDWMVILSAVVMGIRKPLLLVLALGCLFCSQSFLDYSGSGLENPLLHALAAMICLVLWNESKLGASRTLALLSFLFGICLLARLDTLFVVGPVVAFQFIRLHRVVGRRRTMLALLLGMSPFFAWECFSIVYYGALIPNTALAKLPPGYPRADLVHKGLVLIQATALQDPGTLFSIVAIPIALWLLRSRLWLPSMIASAASLTYVIWVGGDFMLGRFLSFVFVFSWMCLLAGTHHSDIFEKFSRGSRVRTSVEKYALALLFVALAGLSILSFSWQVQSNKFSASYDFQSLFKGEVSDERSYYNVDSSLRAVIAGHTPTWVAEGETVKRFLAGRKALVAKRAIGMFGYGAGPNVFILDLFSLADPFLARLPSCRAARPGHFARPMPTGYAESLMTGRNAMTDPLLARLLDDTVLATRAPLGASGRMAAIWRLNAGTYRDPRRLAAYVETPGGVQNVGVDRGSESIPCLAVANSARTDFLAIADYGVQSTPWSASALSH
jgi:arabinofuranosyltransferase